MSSYAIGSCQTGLGSYVVGTVDPNTTYLIAARFIREIMEEIMRCRYKYIIGALKMMILVMLDTNSNFELENGTTLVGETNACSVGDVVFPDCDSDDQTNQVFYYIESALMMVKPMVLL
ncbi:MAG: hypothetical protein R2771_15795 [Saprospiraceae bacterium]